MHLKCEGYEQQVKYVRIFVNKANLRKVGIISRIYSDITLSVLVSHIGNLTINTALADHKYCHFLTINTASV